MCVYNNDMDKKGGTGPCPVWWGGVATQKNARVYYNNFSNFIEIQNGTVYMSAASITTIVPFVEIKFCRLIGW